MSAPQRCGRSERDEASYSVIDRQAAAGPDRFEVRATADSHFAWIRTRLSLDTALMAWARAAVALIGFRFAIVQFSEGFDALEHIPLALQPQAARYLVLALIAVGVVGLLVSILQYRYLTRYLWRPHFAAIAGVPGLPEWTRSWRSRSSWR
jgi:putative membrane protein